MAYATVADVQARLLGVFVVDGSSEPSSTEVTQFLAERSGELDAALSARGVSTPVGSPSSYVSHLGALEAAGATAHVLAVKFPDAAGSGSLEGAIAYWMGVWDQGLAAIKDGTGLPDELVASSSGLPSTFFTAYPDDAPDLGTLVEKNAVHRDTEF